MNKGCTLFKCGNQDHPVYLSYRDVHLLDGKYFLGGLYPGWHYRKLFGLNFISGFGVPQRNICLATFDRESLLYEVKSLLRALKRQEDLITFSYQYTFSAPSDRPGLPADHFKGTHGGCMSGIRIGGLYGSIDVRPSGYCDLELRDILPDNESRIIEIIDFRVRKEIQTQDHGILKVRRRRAEVGWFEVLPPLISFLEESSEREVSIFHV